MDMVGEFHPDKFRANLWGGKLFELLCGTGADFIECRGVKQNCKERDEFRHDAHFCLLFLPTVLHAPVVLNLAGLSRIA
jgi:hypothetical protein